MTIVKTKEEYHKIQSIYKRYYETNKFLIGIWATPELELLQDIQWEFTEKVDGTNIRIKNNTVESMQVEFGGRTENSQIPTLLLKVLMEKFSMESILKVIDTQEKVVLYGEGYGYKIQKGGKYNLGDKVCDFVLFDVKIGDWWLKRFDVNDLASQLGIKSVPVIGEGTLHDAIKIVKGGLQSQWGDFEAEGIVARPKVDLFSRNGSRIITKIKGKDFK